jgi:predicted dehydrogenase
VRGAWRPAASSTGSACPGGYTAGVVTRIAFLGFRHGHVRDAYRRASERPDVEIVAASEEDAGVRAALEREGAVKVTHRDHRKLLETVDCDAVVVGTAFGARGAIVADALASGRHVLADKPACTSLAELDRIEALARANDRAVGMMLEMRDAGVFIGMRRLVRDGAIGEVRAAAFGGQHPLLSATRPAWYHRQGCHGGTINDIAIHAIDLIPWATGLRFVRIVAAREWRRGVPRGSHFQNAAQVMLALDNEAGVIGDVSYLSPDSHGYSLPLYWRFTLWGSGGVLETSLNARQIMLFKDGESAGRALPPGPPDPGGYLESFLREVRGERAASPGEARLGTADVLGASRVALRAQEAASRGLRDVEA